MLIALRSKNKFNVLLDAGYICRRVVFYQSYILIGFGPRPAFKLAIIRRVYSRCWSRGLQFTYMQSREITRTQNLVF